MNNTNIKYKEPPPSETTGLGIMTKMKKSPSGIFMLGDDGVMRSFTGPSTRDVLDAVPLSPAQIKQYLDMRPWTQEAEDRFRGVDGRKVVDHQALFHPPAELDRRR